MHMYVCVCSFECECVFLYLFQNSANSNNLLLTSPHFSSSYGISRTDAKRLIICVSSSQALAEQQAKLEEEKIKSLQM